MTSKYSQGIYKIQNPEKYVGNRAPRYRSSWEHTFMMFCDNNPSVQQWSSESVKIPYRDPLTNRQTIYVPDFFIQYVDKAGSMLVELIEVKPRNQSALESVGKSKYNQAQYVKNQAKWQAAQIWCKRQGIKFRVLSEGDLFHQGGVR